MSDDVLAGRGLRSRSAPLLPGGGVRHWLPLGFVIILLFALVAIPVFSERRIRSYEERLNEIVEPARAAVSDLYLARGLVGGALRQYLATGSRAALARQEQAVLSEQRALERLEPFARVLGGSVEAEYEALRSAIDQWRREIPDLAAGAPPDPSILFDSDLDERAFIAAARLDRELARVGETLRLQMRAAKQGDVALAAVLLFFAVVAAAVVGRAGRRLHTEGVAAERARAELARVNESRARLVRGFSHDVKNPLGAADGYAELLEDGVIGEMTGEQVQAVRRVRSTLRTALDLIDDLIELARAEAGHLDVNVTPVDLAALVRQLGEEYSAVAGAKRLRLHIECATEPLTVESDDSRVRQILSNLLSNAVKYTPRGGRISVTAQYAPARRGPDPRSWAVVSVQDTGPGIPLEQQGMLFQEFSRLDPGGSRGAGLGLAISQGLAHALGGQITVRSKPGEGSAFTLWLPGAARSAVPSD